MFQVTSAKFSLAPFVLLLHIFEIVNNKLQTDTYSKL